MAGANRFTESDILRLQQKGLKVNDPIIDQKLKKAFGIRKISEDELQIMVMNYVRAEYPGVLSFHVPNGGSRNPIEGGKLKRMGVLRGVSDVFIIKKTTLYSGLIIELKVRPNKVTLEQYEFLVKISKEGFCTQVCFDFDEAKLVIDTYLK